MSFEKPRALRAGDPVEGFDCGATELNTWLARHAVAAQGAGTARTMVSMAGDRIAGYYALAAGQVAHETAPARMRRGVGGYPIPVVLLARLAVDRRDQRRGLGAALVRDALLRTTAAADQVGVRAVVMHALDDHAAAFYRRFGFVETGTDRHHLGVLLKDVRRLLKPR